MRVAIVGGGPAGLMAAAHLLPPAEVLLFERNDRPGRKLLLSGSGHCNLTHTGLPGDFLPRYGDHGKFLAPALYAFPPEKLLEFLRLRGVECLVREDGKIFPRSGKARDVLFALLRAASHADLKTNRRVDGISFAGGVFTLGSAGETCLADRVILSTGGLSYPRTGSSGDGFELAKTLGHRIVQPKPSLCGVLSPGLSSLAGNTFPGAELFLFRSGKILRRSRGDLLFTHRGVSGPGVLDLSRFIEVGDELGINFLHPEEPEPFLAAFPSLLREAPRHGAGAFLNRFPLTRALQDHLLARVGIDREKRCADLSRKEARFLAENLVRFRIPVAAVEGFESAMATAGGVALEEVNPKTLESRIVPGLFFAGEVLDIDGDTGGYNLQAAFSTGFLAARSCGEA